MADDAVTPTREIVTRAEARAAGLKYYFTGKPCPRGHVDVRHVNGACVPCERERVRKLSARKYATDPSYRERAKRQTRQRHEALIAAEGGVEKINQEARTRYHKRMECPERAATHREKWRASKRAYYENNPDACKAQAQKRRARIAGSGGSFTANDVIKMLERQRHKCVYCPADLRKGYHIDHIMPLALGGSNWPSNLQGLCPKCNMSKGPKHPIDFAQEKGRLL